MTSFIKQLKESAKDILTLKAALATIFASVTFIIGMVERIGISFSLAFASIVASATIFVASQWKIHNLKFPRRDEREDRKYNVQDSYFTKKSIRIIDFISGAEPFIDNKVFEDCVIYGPCFLTPLDRNSFEAITLIADKIDSSANFVVEVPEGQRKVGGVGLYGCRFIRCKFIGIGFIGTKEFANEFIKNVPFNKSPNY